MSFAKIYNKKAAMLADIKHSLENYVSEDLISLTCYASIGPVITSSVAYAGKHWFQVDPVKVAATTLTSSVSIIAIRLFCFGSRQDLRPESSLERAALVTASFLPHAVGLGLGWLKPVEAISILSLTVLAHAVHYIACGFPLPAIANLDDACLPSGRPSGRPSGFVEGADQQDALFHPHSSLLNPASPLNPSIS